MWCTFSHVTSRIHVEQKRALEDERASKLAGMTADLAAVSLKIEAEQVCLTRCIN